MSKQHFSSLILEIIHWWSYDHKSASQSQLVWLTPHTALYVIGLSEQSVFGACMRTQILSIRVQSVYGPAVRSAFTNLWLIRADPRSLSVWVRDHVSDAKAHLITIGSEVVSQIQIWRQPSVPQTMTASGFEIRLMHAWIIGIAAGLIECRNGCGAATRNIWREQVRVYSVIISMFAH